MSVAELEAQEIQLEAPSGLWRDAWYRLIRNPGAVVGFVLVAVSVGLSVGLVLGAIAGYAGGLLDSVIMRLMDIMLAIPGLLLAIGLVAALGQGLWQIMVAVGVVNIPIFARLLRGSVLAQKENEFIV